MKGSFLPGAVALVCALAACGSSDDGRHIGDGAVDQILISPPDATVTVIDRAAVTQAYTAMLVHPDGSKEDITSTAVFSLADDQYGSFAAQTATLTGGGAGVTHVNALSTSGAVGTTTLTVNVKLTVVGTGVDPGVPDMFDNAAEDASLAPTIVYPNDSILVPPNLGKFDVHWTNNPATNTANVFRSEIANQYIDVKLYTTGIQTDGSPFWDQYAPDAWFPIASSKQQLTLAVAAMNTADPSKKGTSASQHVDVTNENARGGIYYWTSTLQAVYRYDIAAPDVAPAPFFTQGNAPGCMGCHSLSRDGARIAMTTQVGGGPGAVYDVGSQMLIGGTTRQWNFATFNMAADKLVVANTPGEMDLISATDQSLIAMIPPVTPNGQAAAPEISPDNTKLV
ncbi:MAG TPA: hypothetical protein VGC41_17785, partial [Kofleriaceae bacterium]